MGIDRGNLGGGGIIVQELGPAPEEGTVSPGMMTPGTRMPFWPPSRIAEAHPFQVEASYLRDWDLLSAEEDPQSCACGNSILKLQELRDITSVQKMSP